MTQYQKILTIMCRDRHRWYYPHDFMKSGLGHLFVGYEASARLSELSKKYPYMFVERRDGKFIVRKLNPDDFQHWFSLLDSDLKSVVAKELNYYPQRASND